MAAKHLVTYSTWRFRLSARHLARTAQRYGVDHVHSFTPRSLLRAVPTLRNYKQILTARRGAGYWLWKPFAIGVILDTVAEGDLVLYLDAGTEVVAPLTPLFALARDQSIVLFHQTDPYTLSQWTKRDCFIHMGLDNERSYTSPVLCGGYQLYRACPEARQFVTEVTARCMDEGMTTDSPSELGPNLPDFIDHRHDQSVLRPRSTSTSHHNVSRSEPVWRPDKCPLSTSF